MQPQDALLLTFIRDLVRACDSFLARDSIYAIARYMLSPVRLSVCPSVSRVDQDQSKTVEDRIMQLSPQSSPITSFLMLNLSAKFRGNIGSWGAE